MYNMNLNKKHSYLFIKKYQLIGYEMKINIERKIFQKKIDSLE